jgi:hypothetical protein
MIIWVPGGLFAIKVVRVGAGAPDAYMRRMLTIHVITIKYLVTLINTKSLI